MRPKLCDAAGATRLPKSPGFWADKKPPDGGFCRERLFIMENNALPRHIAIIMDGNGRWAKQRGLPRKMGHAAGSETFRRIATYCKNLGVEYLTVYAFSTENWKRSQDEVQAIMALFEKYLHEAIDEMCAKKEKELMEI